MRRRAAIRALLASLSVAGAFGQALVSLNGPIREHIPAACPDPATVGLYGAEIDVSSGPGDAIGDTQAMTNKSMELPDEAIYHDADGSCYREGKVTRPGSMKVNLEELGSIVLQFNGETRQITAQDIWEALA